MLISEAMKLPEADPIKMPPNSLGYAAPKNEGEHEWFADGHKWWSFTDGGVRYRQRYDTSEQ
jgi:hypothetical protein